MESRPHASLPHGLFVWQALASFFFLASTVYCWGYGAAGQLGDGESGPTSETFTPVLVSGVARRAASSSSFFLAVRFLHIKEYIGIFPSVLEGTPAG